MTVLGLLAGVLVGLYAALCALLYFQQENFLFVRVANDPRIAKEWQPRRVQIPAGSIEIEGWWAESGGGNELVIIYFGGNAEDVLYSAVAAKRLHAERFLTSNYRGYGTTPGSPSEATIFGDALAVYDYTIQQPGVKSANIVLMGRSLGSGVATYVAANRDVKGVVLVTPYDSMSAVAQTHYRYFPISLLLKHRFPSAEFAHNIRASVLIVSAEHDMVIPAIHSQRLFDAWQGPKRHVVMQGVGHNDVDRNGEYYGRVNEYLDSIARQ